MTDTATKATRARTLYERDFFAWTKEQGERLRARAHNDIDWENVAEEIESLGRRDRTEIRNRLRVLIMHLTKWAYQPAGRCHSWQSTIGEQRTHIQGILDDSPSLKPFPGTVLKDIWEPARQKAILEAGRALEAAPEEPEWTIEQILDWQFMPGPPWSPDDLIRD
jgi:hypothetical protein